MCVSYEFVKLTNNPISPELLPSEIIACDRLTVNTNTTGAAIINRSNPHQTSNFYNANNAITPHLQLHDAVLPQMSQWRTLQETKTSFTASFCDEYKPFDNSSRIFHNL